MADSCIETKEAPEWLQKLESQREKLSKGKLGHDSGAGAPCISCGPDCPGLDLHFWRKVCRSCHCSKDVHDVPDDELSGWAQFQLLGTNRPNKSHLPVIKIRGVTDEPVKLDWAPPNTSTELVSDYMSCLGSELAPVAGTPAAKRWRAQLRTQLPHHDVTPRENGTSEETSEHKEYISRIKEHMVGVGNVIRVGDIQTPNTYTLETPKTHTTPQKSYALHLKLSNISKGIKYNVVPKNTTDKKLVLDNQGNVVSSAVSLPDYRNSQYLSNNVKDKLNAMKIEADRIKSAVENGSIYDDMFDKLVELKTPIDSDIYLKPIKMFRAEFLRDPIFRDEVVKYAKNSLGAVPVNELRSPNNNSDVRGTIFAPDGEVWSWKRDGRGDSQPYVEELNEENPPTPNYGTYPGQVRPNRDQYGSSSPRTRDVAVLPGRDDGYRSPLREQRVNSSPFDAQKGKESPANKYRDVITPVEDYANRPPHSRPIEVQTTPPPNVLVPKAQYPANAIVDQLSGLSLARPIVAAHCKRCAQPLLAGQVGVQVTRNNRIHLWHPACFSCAKCSQLLADLLYFYHDDEVYCARDVATLLGVPRCAGCDHLIFTTYTAAEGNSYHVNHFCCYYCDLPLGGKKYVADGKSGQPICLMCYENVEAERCLKCDKPIGASEQGVSWGGVHWHASCFRCAGAGCDRSLLGSSFTVKENYPFCSIACVRSVLG